MTYDADAEALKDFVGKTTRAIALYQVGRVA